MENAGSLWPSLTAARRRGILGHYAALRSPAASLFDGLEPFGVEREALGVLFAAKIEATRRRLPAREVSAALRALLDERSAAFRELAERKAAAKVAARERRVLARRAAQEAERRERLGDHCGPR